MQNRQWLINGQPRGRAVTVEDFVLNEVQMEQLQPGEIRTKVRYLSFDPSQKGQMENVGYAAATGLGQVMIGRGIGEVIESANERIKPGDTVMGPMGWQDYATVKVKDVEVVANDELLTARLGPLGGTGLTAYFGLLRHGHPEPGDTLVVSGAAGATGSIVGQIGKLAGCNVIGIAGGTEKCTWLVDELGFDAAIDYRSGNTKQRLKELCPQGVNVFFDNVGGDVLNDVLARIALNARVVVCGGISRYQAEGLPTGPANYMNLIFQRASMSGFLMTDYVSEAPKALARLEAWIRNGDIQYKEDVQHGFDNIPATLMRLFEGKNFGKQLLKLD